MKTVLLVDDDASVRRAVRTTLRSVEVEIYEAANGQEALDLLRGGLRPVIIISDNDMPVLRGLELAKICKDEFPAIPFVLCSGGPQPLPSEMGGIDFYAKGLDSPLMLREHVKAVL